MPSIVVAYNNQRVIGSNNDIPWKSPEDSRHFRLITEGGVVIMGRRTWESLGKRPLRNRVNIILSSTIGPDYCEGGYICSRIVFGSEGEVYAASLEAAINYARELVIYQDYKDIYIIGGESVYKEALDKDLVDTVIATEINDSSPGDRFFPSLDSDWSLFTQHELSEKALVKVYVRDIKNRMRCSCSVANSHELFCRT